MRILRIFDRYPDGTLAALVDPVTVAPNPVYKVIKKTALTFAPDLKVETAGGEMLEPGQLLKLMACDVDMAKGAGYFKSETGLTGWVELAALEYVSGNLGPQENL